MGAVPVEARPSMADMILDGVEEEEASGAYMLTDGKIQNSLKGPMKRKSFFRIGQGRALVVFHGSSDNGAMGPPSAPSRP